MDVFRQWMLCIIIAAAAGTFVCVLSPRGSTDKTVRAVVGIFVVVTICTPLSKLEKTEIAEYAFAESYDGEEEDNALQEQVLTVCKNAVVSEISDLADEYDITIENIITDAYIDENNCIIMHSVQLDINSNNGDSVSDFLIAAEEKIGIPVKVSTE